MTTEQQKREFTATMTLPKGGLQAWTKIMQGSAPVAPELQTGDVIVEAYAVFEDGTKVAGGVEKSDDPTEYNIKFMRVLDANGNEYPGWPIDTSDNEDFFETQYGFVLTEDGDEYSLNIVEAQY